MEEAMADAKTDRKCSQTVVYIRRGQPMAACDCHYGQMIIPTPRVA
jgi:hypothetical protein